ncbi:MAG: hypothetical protein PHP64_07430 [Actinomycetota bacterium]|nr:hypothetical protein [Actinomycetota bacterium]
MSRGLLDAIDMERISREVPDLSNLQDMVLQLSLDSISMSSPHESNVPIAAVCFQDAFKVTTSFIEFDASHMTDRTLY